MKFIETELKGAYVIEPDIIEDERGFFARTFCKEEFEAQGLNPNLVQCSISFNKRQGTIRGMHYQVAPHEEVKLVRCTMGIIYDVIIDIRPESLTFRKWFAVELSQENHKMLYISEGLAHGFQTLADSSEVFYQMSGFYHLESTRGLRWDDPASGIEWPLPATVVSRKDSSYPDWEARR
jgi:dTDP-4-dehydrorhamnose 3,5-epimerase